MNVRIRNNDIPEVPLFLLPQVIAKQILKTGDRIYRISVKRTHWHHYNVSVRTKSLPRELLPAGTIVCRQGARASRNRRGGAEGSGT